MGNPDHWCDIIDHSLNLTEWNRKKVWRMGDLSFQNLINAKLFCLSSIAKSFSRKTREFPQPVKARENSWFSQTFFSNSNIVTQMQHRRGRGFKLLPVSQTYLNLPPNLTINLNELYDGGRFIEEPALENLIRLLGNINCRIGENTRIQLMYILGQGSHHDGVKKSLEIQHHCSTQHQPDIPQAIFQF